MAATKFTEAEREKLFAQLEAPFDPALIKWRVMRTFDNGRSGVILPFADPRAYTDRLNELFTPSGWTREYTISTVPSLCRMERGKAIVTSKVLVATAVTISRLGSHTGTGEEWADRENAITAADAQAFKRACSCFGLGRYLYRFGETRVRLNSCGEPVAIPTLPEWALPPGMTMAQANGLAGDTRGDSAAGRTQRRRADDSERREAEADRRVDAGRGARFRAAAQLSRDGGRRTVLRRGGALQDRIGH
jgi:hypothetical protein